MAITASINARAIRQIQTKTEELQSAVNSAISGKQVFAVVIIMAGNDAVGIILRHALALREDNHSGTDHNADDIGLDDTRSDSARAYLDTLVITNVNAAAKKLGKHIAAASPISIHVKFIKIPSGYYQL